MTCGHERGSEAAVGGGDLRKREKHGSNDAECARDGAPAAAAAADADTVPELPLPMRMLGQSCGRRTGALAGADGADVVPGSDAAGGC
jgi:hypothetical protein